MAHGQGYYSTIREDTSGAITSYIHDRPLLVDSTYIMKRTATGEAWSNDGGQSWNSGRDADGRMLATVLSAIGINAEWINVGGDPLDVALDDIKSNVVYKVDLISTRGSVATSDTWESRLLARVYHGSTDITDEIDPDALSGPVRVQGLILICSGIRAMPGAEKKSLSPMKMPGSGRPLSVRFYKEVVLWP